MANSPWVVDVSMENFQQVVVDGSRERPVVIVATNAAARGAGLRAGDLARTAAGVLGGGGGGKDDVAQGGGADASLLGPALEALVAAVAGGGRA